MDRSLSQTIVGSRQNRQQTQKWVYINEQCRKKTEKNSMQTIFHSPYKDGRKNKDFSNPTFMSSDIICNREFSPFNPCTPKKAIVHTEAQNKQKALYNRRMNRSQSFTNIAQKIRNNSKSLKKKTVKRETQKVVHKEAQRAEQGKNAPNLMNSTLQKQLEGLLKFREERQLKQCNRDPSERYFRKTSKKENQVPVYLQKFYQNPNYDEEQESRKKTELQQWVGLSKELQSVKEQIKKEKHRTEVNAISRDIDNQQAFNQQRELLNRKNAQLLNKILLQQIKAKDRESVVEKKEKGWRFF